MSLKNEIIIAVTKLVAGQPRPQGNSDTLLHQAFMWDEIARLASGKSKEAWKALEPLLDETDLHEGENLVCKGQKFAASVKLSKPVKRFNAEAMAAAIMAKFKVAKHIAVELVENKGKKATAPMKSYYIEEV